MGNEIPLANETSPPLLNKLRPSRIDASTHANCYRSMVQSCLRISQLIMHNYARAKTNTETETFITPSRQRRRLHTFDDPESAQTLDKLQS